MTNQTQVVPFQFETHEIRTVVIDTTPYFSARDVAVTLGYENQSQAYNLHCKALKLLSSLECRELNWINPNPRGEYVIAEPDVYRLIVKSTKPQAERFERWVFEEVLPTIRKTGGYQHQAKKPTYDVEKYNKFMEALHVAVGIAEEMRRMGVKEDSLAVKACSSAYEITGVDIVRIAGLDQTPQLHHSPQIHHRTPQTDPKQTVINLFVRRGTSLTEREIIQNVKGSNPFKSFAGSQTAFIKETIQELVNNGSLTCVQEGHTKIYDLTQ